MKYSFTVFLVPKVSNRASVADAAVQFVKIDEASPDELQRLEKLNVLIREKHIPIANLDTYKPGEIIQELKKRVKARVDMHVHTKAWKYYQVRPMAADPHPERTLPQYCIYDAAHEDYVYTKAWIDKLAKALGDAEEYARIVGHAPAAA